jgi:hypothetical protein
MSVRPKIVRLQASLHVLIATLLVGALAIFMMLTAGVAQACPRGKEASTSVSIAHKIKRVGGIAHEAKLIVTTASASSPALVLAKTICPGSGLCCGGDSHSHGLGCASTCCSACSAAIDVASLGFFLLDGRIGHVLPPQDELASTRPPPDFRPPRIFA